MCVCFRKQRVLDGLVQIESNAGRVEASQGGAVFHFQIPRLKDTESGRWGQSGMEEGVATSVTMETSRAEES